MLSRELFAGKRANGQARPIGITPHFCYARPMQKKRKPGRVKPAANASLPSWTAVLLLIVVSLLAYANTIPGKFVFDDTVIVQGNPAIQALDAGHLNDIFG